MKVLALTAEPAEGGRILLRWRTPEDPAFRGVRVLRRERRFPSLADLGSALEVFQDSATGPGAAASFLDGPLQGETVHYYAVVALDAAGRKDPATISALAPTPYQTDGYLFRSLPEIYQLLDQASGTLRRLTEVIGQPLDLVRSFTGAMRDLHDLERVDGGLVPLLGQWIAEPADVTLDLDRQRNAVRFAPHYYRTTGVAANLRAALNRYVNWDVRIKELVHTIFLSTHPEQLVLGELRRDAGTWGPPANVNLEVAYEGRAAPLLDRDGRTWLVYHARRTAAAASPSAREGPGADLWHLFAKLEAGGEALPAVRLTFGDGVNKRPAAVQRPDGATWIFHARHAPAAAAGRLVPALALQVVAVGRPAAGAQVVGARREPFTLADGQVLEVIASEGAVSAGRRVTVRAENVPGFPTLDAAGVARWLDAELPGVDATATGGGAIRLRTRALGAGAGLSTPASTLGTALGFGPGAAQGVDATTATLTGTREAPFALADGDTLVLRVDDDGVRTVPFVAAEFADVAQATAAEVVAAVERRLPGVAEVAGKAVRLRSRRSGASSVVAVLSSDSTAAAALGFGAPVPPAPAGVEEDEPSALVDAAGGVWLFWASRRSGGWKLWCSRFDGTSWADPRPLTVGPQADREPFALLDAAAGRLWVFWTRRQPGTGLRNVMVRTTTQLDFGAQAEADWTEREATSVPAGFENREPAAALGAAPGSVELFFTSNRVDGWNVWTRPLTATAQGPEAAVTSGQVTRRAPAPLRAAGGADPLRLFVRSNASQPYSSALYPSATTIDARYSGSTTIDLRNATRLSLRGNQQDMQRCTYDTRSSAPSGAAGEQVGLYARNKVALFLKPDTNDQAFITRESHLFASALRRFLPIQVEVVFLIEQAFTDLVYGYERGDGAAPLIGEQVVDVILSEVVPGASDAFADRAPGVRFLRTWTPGETSGLPDLAGPGPALSSRLFTTRFDEGA